MLKIGLTGSFGTGKTAVAAMFAKRGAKIIDADAIIRELLTKNQKCIKKVAKDFSHVILLKGETELDRKKLSKVVFQNPRELKKLTDILYPEALKEVKRQIRKYKHAPLVVLDVPLLFEAGWDRLTDINIVVRASLKDQIQRIQKRMAISNSDIRKRLKFQMPLKNKCLLADIIIDNSGALTDTRAQVSAIIDRLFKRKQ